MDWSKAKSIFIIVFIVLNIFLLYFINLYSRNGSISKEVLASTEQILSGRGVKLECKLPAVVRNAQGLLLASGREDLVKAAARMLGADAAGADSFKSTSAFQKGTKAVTLNNGSSLVYEDSSPGDKVNIKNKREVERYIAGFLSNAGFAVRDYTLDNYNEKTSGSVVLTYTGKYRGQNLFDNTLEAEVTNKGVTKLTCNYKKVKGFSNGNSDTILPVHQVLLKNLPGLTGADKKETVITRIDLGYKSPGESEEEMQGYSEGLAWRITFKDGTQKFFEARSGIEIK